ncbi:unnamed protein product [Moneuplotes crassus]|uniref:Bromodomain associated domain-containing protein n=1 Tax=Euplotes crassus TaxID=5936 RepID=A0AAD2CZW0_EUPCR|nr:unnamed protein product [Moneuplotes crassus]
MLRSTKDPDVFLDALIMKNIAELAMEKNFTTADKASLVTLCAIVKKFLAKIIGSTKNYTELNCRTDSNVIDALSGILETMKIPQKQIIKHIQDRPFSKGCWKSGVVDKMLTIQQDKANKEISKYGGVGGISSDYKQTLYQDPDHLEGPVAVVPEEIKNFKGFASIPPFLRIFPSKLALQNMNKNEYKEKEEKSSLLKIKNKREIEDKLIEVSLINAPQPTSSPTPPIPHPQEALSPPDPTQPPQPSLSSPPNPSSPSKDTLPAPHQSLPPSVPQTLQEETSQLKLKKRAAKGVAKIKEAESLFC